MTRPIGKHLDSTELDALISPSPDRVPESVLLTEEALSEARRHLEGCDDCNRKVQMHRQVQGEIADLGVYGTARPRAGCPRDIDWVSVAAGVLQERETRELMLHAAQCGECGPSLRKATGALADEATPEEETLLGGLRTSEREWRREMAVKLGRSAQRRIATEESSRSWWGTLRLWQRLSFAAATLAAVALAGWLGTRALRPPSAEQLLAQAYVERRTLELRIPGAKYAPMRVERNVGGTSPDKSPSLLKAEALISGNLSKHPSDPSWLQARARADLLK